jgi:hypothetical protein
VIAEFAKPVSDATVSFLLQTIPGMGDSHLVDAEKGKLDLSRI